MYLKSLVIKNFRKFGTSDNKIEFVDGTSYRNEESNEINIASTTTLIVGKNNTGKSTIINALEKIVNEKRFNINDFNFVYLQRLLNCYTKKYDKTKKLENIIAPTLEFIINIGFENDYTENRLGNLAPFLTLDNVTQKKEIQITVKFEIMEHEIFIQELIKLLEKNLDSEKNFVNFLKILESIDFELNYYRENGDKVPYNLKNLIDITSIKANIVDSDTTLLTKAFNKIINYRYKTLLEVKDREEFEKLLDNTNTTLTEIIKKQHTEYISESLKKIVTTDNLSFSLTADLTLEKIMKNLVKYEYIEGGIHIPENQFGLGYTNLMMIIAELVDYMEKYPQKSFDSMVNIISIEEPETYMHPQMQELFINNINDAVITLLESKGKNINSQLIITTHSSHILNSKIHSGNTFNNINYLTSKNHYTKVVNLNDKNIIGSDTNEDDLNFIKKHIKYKVSELFFADAVIFVEGVTEETLIKYFIDKKYNSLNKYYITIFNIDGAHGFIYHKLIKLLKIPCLIITDLDIKRDDNEKNEFKQINCLKGKETTNETIINYKGSKLDNIESEPYYESENIYITFQGEKIEDYFATSFEESLILTNYNNQLLNDTLRDTRKIIYRDAVKTESGINYEIVKENSYYFQQKLSEKKSKFANKLLYSLITNEDNDLKLPKYITNGLDWLTKKLKED